MKKFVIFTLASFMIAISSCGDKGDTNDNRELVGSCWELEQEDSPYEYVTICFGSEGASYSYKMNMTGVSRRYELKYMYKKPNITITHKDGSRFGRGRIEDNVLILTGGTVDTDGKYVKWDR